MAGEEFLVPGSLESLRFSLSLLFLGSLWVLHLL